MEKTILVSTINIATSGNSTIIAAITGRKINITSFLFTAGGEVNVTLKDGASALTGAMDFGGTSEPRGMVASLDGEALKLSVSSAFVITLSANVQLSGLACYYIE